MVRARLVQIVQDRRRRLGWTQHELAEVLGSSTDQVSLLEADDPSVSLDLILEALDAMDTSLRVEVDTESDILADPALDDVERTQVGRELLRRRLAHRIATDAGVDEGDVRNVLVNLELSPLERLATMFRRANLQRQSIH